MFKNKALICILIMLSLLLCFHAFAEGDLPEGEATEELITEAPSDMMTESERTDSSDVIADDETITIEPIEGADDSGISLMGTFDTPR